MERIAGQNDDATGRIRLEFIGVEPIAHTKAENAGDHCVHAILRVAMWHQLYAVGRFDPDGVGPASDG
jgi:hypothetical protein